MSSFHLAGIIPVAGKALDFNMPWHDSLMPISENYLAVERSVVECAYAGCETIWIVCNDDMQPLIKHRIGEYVQDPVWAFRSFEKFQSNAQKRIPIYYVPISAHDRGKRDSLGWAALHGMYASRKVAKSLSKWITPDRYYVSFPYGVYDVEILRDYRNKLSSHQSTFVSFQNKTIRDGEYLGFTMSWNEAEKIRKKIWKIGTIKKDKKTGELLPLHERYSAASFSLKDIYDDLNCENATIIDLKKYWNIASWKDYCAYIGDSEKNIARPNKTILGYHQLKRIRIKEEHE
jgi:hypothetical protein